MIDHQFIKSFKKAIIDGLPGENSHSRVLPVNRSTSKIIVERDNIYRASAVGIILYPFQSSIHCILIQRPKYEGAHGGQISFPGGKMDEEDISLEHTARRECAEEINLPIDLAYRIGELSEVTIAVSSFVVKPFVFFVKELPILEPDPREVESIISFDLFSLREHTILKTADFQLKMG